MGQLSNADLIKVRRAMGFGTKCPQIDRTGPHQWSVSIGAGNDLVPSGTKQ